MTQQQPRLTLDDIKSAIAWRESGLTISVIADKLKLPISTTKALLKRYNVSKGASRGALVQVARDKLINDTSLSNMIASQISASITNQLSMARQIEDECSTLFEQLSNDTRTPISVRARTLSSIASAAQMAQSLAFKALDIENKRNEIKQTDLPTLVIEGYTESEMLEIRKKSSMTDIELAQLDEGVIDERKLKGVVLEKNVSISIP